MAGSASVESSEDLGGVYGWGTVLTLRAHPGVKSYFIEWSGDCSGTDPATELTMDGDKTCTATFGYPVGGILVPVDRLGLAAPLMVLAGLVLLAALTAVWVRRHVR